MSTCTLGASEGFDFFDEKYRLRVQSTMNSELTLERDASHFVVVHQGEMHVSSMAGAHVLRENCFGSFFGPTVLKGEGNALILSTFGYQCPTLLGVPVERLGRLRYVDGCTASLLIPPPIRGEPCLNFMHLPPRIVQTLHTHPSPRVGLILSGSGKCETEDGLLSFQPGTVFFIPREVAHSFQSGDQELRVVIYHPDSDSGPTHADHTMLNRTHINGQQVRSLMHSQAAVKGPQ